MAILYCIWWFFYHMGYTSAIFTSALALTAACSAAFSSMATEKNLPPRSLGTTRPTLKLKQWPANSYMEFYGVLNHNLWAVTICTWWNVVKSWTIQYYTSVLIQFLWLVMANCRQLPSTTMCFSWITLGIATVDHRWPLFCHKASRSISVNIYPALCKYPQIATFHAWMLFRIWDTDLHSTRSDAWWSHG